MVRGLPNGGIWAFALVMLVAATGLRGADAETKIETKIVEYDVPGATAAEVNATLARTGPYDMYLGRAYATTRSRIRWSFDYKPTDEGCVIAGALVTADITITIPRFVDASKMSPKLRRAYSAYAKNLMGHERGHEQRTIAAVQRIERRIRALPPQPVCEQIRQKASAVGYDVYQEFDQANRAYDKRERRRLEGDLRLPSD